MTRDGTSTRAADDEREVEHDSAANDHVRSGAASDKVRIAISSIQPLTREGQSQIASGDAALGEHVCRVVSAAMSGLGLTPPTAFTADAQALLRNTWSIASLLRNNPVTPLHLAAALISAHERLADGLTSIGKAERSWLLAGALVRPAVLDATAGAQPADRIAPQPNLLEWIAEAADYARRERPEAPELRPDDLVAVLVDRHANLSVTGKIKRLLQLAARVGRAPAELVKARQKADNIEMTLGYFRAEAKDKFLRVSTNMRRVDRSLSKVAEALRTLPDRSAIETAVGDVKRSIGEICDPQSRVELDRIATELTAIDSRLARRSAPIELAPVSTALGHLDRRTADIHDLLTPLSPLRLTISVLTVLALGIGAGLLLAAAPAP